MNKFEIRSTKSETISNDLTGDDDLQLQSFFVSYDIEGFNSGLLASLLPLLAVALTLKHLPHFLLKDASGEGADDGVQNLSSLEKHKRGKTPYAKPGWDVSIVNHIHLRKLYLALILFSRVWKLAVRIPRPFYSSLFCAMSKAS